ncbi:MAG TPA: hypothetical protein VF310_03665, partial [Vicinamibacteria bacterium]
MSTLAGTVPAQSPPVSRVPLRERMPFLRAGARALARARRAAQAFMTALMATVAIVPSIATVATVLAYAAPAERGPALRWLHDMAFPAGAVFGCLAWVVVACFYSGVATADSASTRSYDELYQRLRQLDAQLEALDPQRRGGSR